MSIFSSLSEKFKPGETSYVGQRFAVVGIFVGCWIVFLSLAFFLHNLCRRRLGGGSSNNSDTPVASIDDLFGIGHGLSEYAISALPIFEFERNADRSGGDGMECTVCLGPVQGGEMVRRLPECEHVFHAECVDRWLCSHPTCPVCRTVVGARDVAAKAMAGRSYAAMLSLV